MKVTKLADYNGLNSSWSIEDCIERLRELVKEKPERTQMIILVKNPDEWEFSRLIVNMTASEQLALLDSSHHDVLHELME